MSCKINSSYHLNDVKSVCMFIRPFSCYCVVVEAVRSQVLNMITNGTFGFPLFKNEGDGDFILIHWLLVKLPDKKEERIHFRSCLFSSITFVFQLFSHLFDILKQSGSKQSWYIARKRRSCLCGMWCCSWKMGKASWGPCNSSS